ncbi:MAG: cyclic nucleotide-binding domain-containing protein [Rhodospirillaceae bacterium]
MTEARKLAHDSQEATRLADLIHRAPIGSYIGAEGAQILANRACIELTLSPNEYLFRQGEKSASFFLIEEGRLARVRNQSNPDNPGIIHTLEKGDLVGELSCIDGTEHRQGVMALTQATVLQFRESDIEPLITQHPRLMFDFMRAVIKRVHHTANEISKQQMALSDYISSGGKGRM